MGEVVLILVSASDVAVDIDAAAFALDASGTFRYHFCSYGTALTVASLIGGMHISNDAGLTQRCKCWNWWRC